MNVHNQPQSYDIQFSLPPPSAGADASMTVKRADGSIVGDYRVDKKDLAAKLGYSNVDTMESALKDTDGVSLLYKLNIAFQFQNDPNYEQHILDSADPQNPTIIPSKMLVLYNLQAINRGDIAGTGQPLLAAAPVAGSATPAPAPATAASVAPPEVHPVLLGSAPVRPVLLGSAKPKAADDGLDTWWSPSPFLAFKMAIMDMIRNLMQNKQAGTFQEVMAQALNWEATKDAAQDTIEIGKTDQAQAMGDIIAAGIGLGFAAGSAIASIKGVYGAAQETAPIIQEDAPQTNLQPIKSLEPGLSETDALQIKEQNVQNALKNDKIMANNQEILENNTNIKSKTAEIKESEQIIKAHEQSLETAPEPKKIALEREIRAEKQSIETKRAEIEQSQETVKTKIAENKDLSNPKSTTRMETNYDRNDNSPEAQKCRTIQRDLENPATSDAKKLVDEQNPRIRTANAEAKAENDSIRDSNRKIEAQNEHYFRKSQAWGQLMSSIGDKGGQMVSASYRHYYSTVRATLEASKTTAQGMSQIYSQVDKNYTEYRKSSGETLSSSLSTLDKAQQATMESTKFTK